MPRQCLVPDHVRRNHPLKTAWGLGTETWLSARDAGRAVCLRSIGRYSAASFMFSAASGAAARASRRRRPHLPRPAPAPPRPAAPRSYFQGGCGASLLLPGEPAAPPVLPVPPDAAEWSIACGSFLPRFTSILQGEGIMDQFSLSHAMSATQHN